jgi:hypothetical protein
MFVQDYPGSTTTSINDLPSVSGRAVAISISDPMTNVSLDYGEPVVPL